MGTTGLQPQHLSGSQIQILFGKGSLLWIRNPDRYQASLRQGEKADLCGLGLKYCFPTSVKIIQGACKHRRSVDKVYESSQCLLWGRVGTKEQADTMPCE